MPNRFPTPWPLLSRSLPRSLAYFLLLFPLAHGAEDVSGCGVYFLFAFTVFRHTQSSSIFFRYPTTTNQPTQHIKYKKTTIKDTATHVSLRYSVRLLSISLWRALAGSVPSLLFSSPLFPPSTPGLFLFFLVYCLSSTNLSLPSTPLLFACTCC